MSATAIDVTDVGKRFRLKAAGSRSLKAAVLDVLSPKRARSREFWALKDLSFTVESGETLGIIGANGAGKSTLLALLAGTKLPTVGAIRTEGTISSLLELGAGFHPDLTGRENVFLAGAVMGLTRRQMEERLDAIVDFAGIEAFIDQPVKHYSSGMYVRLGFSVAVEVDPDILLIDEVLAVGDIAFQRKCIEKMRAFREAGKTMLIISHDLGTIQSISDRILLLEEGRLVGLGSPGDVVSSYRSRSRLQRAEAVGREWGTGEVTLTRVELLDGEGRPAERFRFGEPLRARIHYAAERRIENPVFGFSIASSGGARMFGNNTQIERHGISAIEGEGALELTIESLTVAGGTYLLSFSVHSADHTMNYHRLDNAFPIEVWSEKEFEGAYMPIRWSGP